MTTRLVCAAGVLLASVLTFSPLSAQDEPASQAAAASEVEAVPQAASTPAPRLARRHPSEPIFLRPAPLDIPQWAKDAGHNGAAVYTATIGADGKLISLALTRSSLSDAIDAAVRERAEALRYVAGTNAAGEKVEATVEIRMSYARFDSESPGGGIDDYSCADFTREYDWFKSVHTSGRPIFWLENAFTSLTNVARQLGGPQPSVEERRANRRKGERDWERLREDCRHSPESLFLSHVEDPEAYRELVESF